MQCMQKPDFTNHPWFWFKIICPFFWVIICSYGSLWTKLLSQMVEFLLLDWKSRRAHEIGQQSSSSSSCEAGHHPLARGDRPRVMTTTPCLGDWEASSSKEKPIAKHPDLPESFLEEHDRIFTSLKQWSLEPCKPVFNEKQQVCFQPAGNVFHVSSALLLPLLFVDFVDNRKKFRVDR